MTLRLFSCELASLNCLFVNTKAWKEKEPKNFAISWVWDGEFRQIADLLKLRTFVNTTDLFRTTTSNAQ